MMLTKVGSVRSLHVEAWRTAELVGVMENQTPGPKNLVPSSSSAGTISLLERIGKFETTTF